MRLIFSERAWGQYVQWQQSDVRTLKKLNGLIDECLRTPFSGTGKPEALKRNLSGWWSRRITEEHRLIYRVEGDDLLIAECRYHYGK